jgi:hypothetical protein
MIEMTPNPYYLFLPHRTARALGFGLPACGSSTSESCALPEEVEPMA